MVLAVLALALFAVQPAHAQPGNLKINEHGFTSSHVCGSCHSAIYSRWKESMHSNSATDPIFQASYIKAFFRKGKEASRLCLRCHSPTTRITENYDISNGITAEGVTCDFCHSLKSTDLENDDHPVVMAPGRTKLGPNKDGKVKVHDVAYSAFHSSARLCATCHEYRANGVPVMSTYSEWKAGPYAEEGKPCQYCHMPQTEGEIAVNVPGRRNGKIFDHNLAGGHSLAQLKKSLVLKIVKIDRKKDRMTVAVDLTNAGSGHRMPTGIPSRKLVMYCKVQAPGGKVYQKKTVYEKVLFDKKGFEIDNDADIMLGLGASIAKDNRIFPKETRREEFTFYLPGAKEATVSAWVEYLYEPLIMQSTEMRIEINRDSRVSQPR